MYGYEEQEDISGGSDGLFDKIPHDDIDDFLSPDDDYKEPTLREVAESMITVLDDNPELFQEFNALLRERKIKKIQDGRKIHEH